MQTCASPPRAGFSYAFENGPDFVAVGMFDFQIAGNAALAGAAVQSTRSREREWIA